MRILVDRLWPRGLTKAAAGVDLWLKNVAPSPQLQTWFGHDPAKWVQFKYRYLHQLASNPAVLQLHELLDQGPARLVYGAKDSKHSHVLVLKQYLEQP